MSQIETTIEELLAPAVSALGLELLGIEFSAGSHHALLRIYIDAPQREGGVNIEDCEQVSREVSALLDVNDPIEAHYTLEVSSPGLDRPLFKPAHYARFIGEPVKITLDLPQDGRRRFQGRVLGVEGETVTVEQDGAPVQLAWTNIQKAKLALVFAPPPKPGKKPADGAKKKPADAAGKKPAGAVKKKPGSGAKPKV